MSAAPAPTLDALAGDLADGRTTSRALVEACLARIADSAGQGPTAFTHVMAESARAAATAMDGLRAAGAAPSPYAGIPVSIKDLFDMAGQVTRAGSRVLDGAAPARADAPAVARLRRAGFVVIGRTNMVEFAYSGLGMNPHHGTPLAPWDRATGHVAGGSSSGAAVSVADGMAHGALGTDTGGSCRIPAAFCGLAGFKPTARRVPLAGAVPLSTSLDSIGPIARSVACCATLDAVLAGDAPAPLAEVGLAGRRFLVPTTLALDGLDPVVAEAFAGALVQLRGAGAAIVEAAVPEFDEVAPMNAAGGFTAAESYAWHHDLLRDRGAHYDPRVASRIRRGAALSARDYLDLLAWRRGFVTRLEVRLQGFDALLMPSVPILPPQLGAVATDEDYNRLNLQTLRNCTFVNMMDGCAISVPLTPPGAAPVGLMVAGLGGADRRVLAIAAAMESNRSVG